MHARRVAQRFGAGAALLLVVVLGGVALAPAAGAVAVGTEAEFRVAFSDPAQTAVTLTADIELLQDDCIVALRISSTALVLDGAGHSITNPCDSGGILVVREGGGLTVKNLELTSGSVGDNGGAIDSDGEVQVFDSTIHGNGAGQAGGAIYSTQSVDVFDSFLLDNIAGGGGAIGSGSHVRLFGSQLLDNGGEGGGGGVSAQFDIEVTESTLRANYTDGIGGALLSGDGAITVTNSTIILNEAAQGGGIAGGLVTLTHATIADNTAADGANIYLRQTNEEPGGSLTTFGSVIAEPGGGGANSAPAEGNTVTSQSFNLSDDTSCQLTTENDVQGEDPKLAPVFANGGRTPTRLPEEGSPLVDAIPENACELPIDQRGIARPQAGACDIGAVEVEAAAPPATPDTTPSAPTTPSPDPDPEVLPVTGGGPGSTLWWATGLGAFAVLAAALRRRTTP